MHLLTEHVIETQHSPAPCSMSTHTDQPPLIQIRLQLNGNSFQQKGNPCYRNRLVVDYINAFVQEQ